uniref:Large ribosomal subunit protein eL14 n=1 Tax=Spadella cephaloptera TaxID=52888 RepID=A8E677_9BILA|nr:TPA: putative 60S ribosomal protein L14 [Spadella cephaloptera]
MGVGVFNNFVEIGKVAYVCIGPYKHRLVAIVDVINQTRALVDGPDVPRKAMQFKHLRLMKYRIKIQHGARTGTVRKAWAEAKVTEQWKESPLYTSIVARRTRARLNDFERFKLSKAKKARNHEINKAYCALKKAAKK